MLTMSCAIGVGTQHLSQCRCKEATSTFHTLQSRHFHEGCVQNQISKTYFEASDHGNAK